MPAFTSVRALGLAASAGLFVCFNAAASPPEATSVAVVVPPEAAQVALVSPSDPAAVTTCRAAILDSPRQPPESKVTSIIEPCRAAICPSLPNPKPEICAIVGPVPPDQHALFAPFVRAVGIENFGLSQTEWARVLDEYMEAAPSSGIVSNSPPHPAPPAVTLAGIPAGIRVKIGAVSADFSPIDESAMATWIAAQLPHPSGGSLTIEAAAATDFSVVRAALAGAQTAGYSQIQFRTTDSVE